ncbi:WD40-repeat-containing domain protein [Neurospora tetraspora]|uniref:WD40-repeat-containing domain protein n=1 Tax=Neurospora tetraspora TaxID=94610 RepID=A0AAE0J8X3_9PEZI|nr:WD40-repeat-containing domain protein [Neurospora tetraspora]
MEKPSLNLVATSTKPDGLFPSALRKTTNNSLPSGQTDSFFKSVQWSADGTTLFTSSSSNRINTFVLPSTLLAPRDDDSPLTLTPQGTLYLPEPTAAIAPCPYFALEQPSTQCILTASTDHPIHLHHAFPQPPPPSDPSDDDDDFDLSTYQQQPKPLATFRLIHTETERYLPITSLLWSYPGTHFLAGSTNCLSLFDVSRPDLGLPSDTPLLTIKTTGPQHKSGNGARVVGMKGTVSALAMQPLSNGNYGSGGNVVSAGTWTRNLGLYDLHRAGACVATWNVSQAASLAGVGGRGVLQTVWSPCGRYLVVNERESSGLLVYDLRGTHRLLACLQGRDGETNQRLSCDVFPGTNEEVGGFEVWAGTREGKVVVWEGVGMREGSVEPSYDFEVHAKGSAVGGTAMHMSGSVLATCSGSWKFPDDDDDDSSSGSDSESHSDSDDVESGTSSSESDSEEEQGRASQQRRGRARPPPAMVEETSLKVWSIGAGNMAESGHQEEVNEPYET